jgi:hypothetical protein
VTLNSENKAMKTIPIIREDQNKKLENKLDISLSSENEFR